MSFTPLVSERHKNFVKSKPSSGDKHQLIRHMEDSEMVPDDTSPSHRVWNRPSGGETKEKMPILALEEHEVALDSSDGLIHLGSDHSYENFSHTALEENPTSPVMPKHLLQISPSRRLLLEEESSMIPAEFTRR